MFAEILIAVLFLSFTGALLVKALHAKPGCTTRLLLRRKR